MKFAIVPHGIFMRDGENYFGNELYGNLIDRLAPYFEEIIVCAPVFQQVEVQHRSFLTYKLRSSNIKFCELPISKGTIDANIAKTVARYIKHSRIMNKQIKTWDWIHIFLPNHLGIISFILAKIYSKPFSIYVAGDWKEVYPYTYRWRVGMNRMFLPVYLVVNKLIASLIGFIVKDSKFTLVHGETLHKRYYDKNMNIHVYRTEPIINLSQQDFYYRKDTCQDTKIKLLFIGSLIPGKGLIYLLDAVAQLQREKINVHLDIVGIGEQESDLKTKTKVLNIENIVSYKGYIPNGAQLFEIYRNSDIFVLPTLSEGFPRVLYEAMSQCVPIITTNVGGIPRLMIDGENAILVSPKNSMAIALAVKKIASDQILRQHLIENGFKAAKNLITRDPAEQTNMLLKGTCKAKV